MLSDKAKYQFDSYLKLFWCEDKVDNMTDDDIVPLRKMCDKLTEALDFLWSNAEGYVEWLENDESYRRAAVDRANHAGDRFYNPI